jgi:hypothetical protein
MRTLPNKGYGRIYCEKPEQVQIVREIICELDAYEFDYLPKDLIAPFSEYPKVTYTHKFRDMDMDALTAICWSRGIKIWVFDSGSEEFPASAVTLLAPVSKNES